MSSTAETTKMGPAEFEAKKSTVPWKRLYAYVAVCLVDILATCTLVYSLSERAYSSVFDHGIADLVAATVIRIVLYPAIGVFAMTVGRPPATPNAECDSENADEVDVEDPTMAMVTPAKHTQGYIGVDENSEEAQADIAKQERRTATLKKNAMLVVMFIANSTFQVYIGAKCISFIFPASASLWPCVLMGSAVVFLNLEAFLMKETVNALTAETGTLYEGVHVHPLTWNEDLAQTHCAKCRKRVREAHQCERCMFNMCQVCLREHENSTKEKGLRGDKGTKSEKAAVSHGEYFQRAIKLARPLWKIFSAAFLCLFIASIASNFMPLFQGKILDCIIQNQPEDFWTLIRVYLTLSVLVGFFEALRALCFNLAGRRMVTSIRNSLFQAVLRQDIAFFDSSTVGDLTSRLTGDARATVSPIQTSLANLLSNVVQLVLGLAMCFVTSWRLSMLAFTAIVPIIYLTETYAKWSSQINKQIATDQGDANTVACEALSNIRTIRAFSTEHLERDNYEEWTSKALSKAVKDAMAGAFTTAINRYLDLGAGVLILWYGGSMAMGGGHTEDSGVSVGSLITFQLYWNRINGAFKGLNNILMQFTRAAGAAQRVLSLLDNEPDINPDTGTPLPPDYTADIEFQDVEFAYQMRPGIKVLDGLSLKVKAGQACALVGRSGCGKSSAIHMAMRFYDPIRGVVRLNGTPLTDLHVGSVHSQMALVAQDTQLFAKSIEENIAYGVAEYTQDALKEATKAANAHEFIMSFPEGYATKVGERGVRLSGGQRQRIALARAILRNPRILLLDEATSALDVESEAQVQQAIDRLLSGGGRTIMVVAHRLSTVVNADTIAVMDAGRCVEQGTHKELLQIGGIYRSLVQKQLSAANTDLETM